ncbi:hypothetical protein QSV34_13640 [Porticoccus sp. W117]|uniref:hypothetical protein n=1 Tax=Porticoccus sp. W117 TaxID=3054777 RepID=UPI002594622B|nr:hypothetical protein [Porticoccus sp. W117]MDM3872391.1 hypothetical protein [Porticoccus sp. W117]
MLRCKNPPEDYLPSIGHLIWLCWDNGEPKRPYSGGFSPAFVLSAESCGADVLLTALPVLGLGDKREGTIKIPYELYSEGYVLIREPITVQCPRHYASLIEPMPEFFIEHIHYALDKMRNS